MRKKTDLNGKVLHLAEALKDVFEGVMEPINKRFDGLEIENKILWSKFEFVHDKVKHIDTKVNNLDTKVNNLDTKLDKVLVAVRSGSSKKSNK